MEGLRVSKLEEGQQWGKNTSSKDKVPMGKKTPFYRWGENPTVIPSLSPHDAVLPHRAAVLPRLAAVLPLQVAVLPHVQHWPDEGLLHRATSGRTAGAVLSRAPTVLP